MTELNGYQNLEPYSNLEFDYDPTTDVMTIEGVKYSGNFFRFFAVTGPSDQKFKIVGRKVDGALIIQKVEEGHE